MKILFISLKWLGYWTKKVLPNFVHHFFTKNNNYPDLQIEFIDSVEKDLVDAIKEKITQLNLHSVDVIVIDGMDRGRVVQDCIELLAKDGLIIIDDSDRYDFTKVFEQNGFSKIDFHGYSPGVILPKCSSIQFKENSIFLVIKSLLFLVPNLRSML